MNGGDLAIGVAAGVVGFALVWWLISLFRQQKAPPVVIGPAEPASPPRGAPALSAAELGSSWHLILGVTPEAGPAEIATAYHARMAECDRVRFSPSEADADRQRAEARREQLNEAFDFARSLRR